MYDIEDCDEEVTQDNAGASVPEDKNEKEVETKYQYPSRTEEELTYWPDILGPNSH